MNMRLSFVIKGRYGAAEVTTTATGPNTGEISGCHPSNRVTEPIPSNGRTGGRIQSRSGAQNTKGANEQTGQGG